MAKSSHQADAGSTRRYRNLQTQAHEDLDPNAEETRQRLNRGEIVEAPASEQTAQR